MNNSNTMSSSNTEEQINVSLGKGLNFGGAVGYMFYKNIGAELGFSYLLGGISEAKQIDSYSNGINTYTSTADYAISSKMFRINPSLVIASGFDKINPYAKFGMVIGAGSVTLDENVNEDGDILEAQQKFDGGIALGLSSGVGALFNISDNMFIFGELSTINLSYAPAKGELIEYKENGIDLLAELTTHEKETEFVNGYSYNSNESPSDSQPSKALQQKLPFGSFGVNFGLRIKI